MPLWHLRGCLGSKLWSSRMSHKCFTHRATSLPLSHHVLGEKYAVQSVSSSPEWQSLALKHPCLAAGPVSLPPNL